MKALPPPTAEDVRLTEDRERTRHWKRWGPSLSERQWAKALYKCGASHQTGWTALVVRCLETLEERRVSRRLSTVPRGGTFPSTPPCVLETAEAHA